MDLTHHLLVLLLLLPITSNDLLKFTFADTAVIDRMLLLPFALILLQVAYQADGWWVIMIHGRSCFASFVDLFHLKKILRKGSIITIVFRVMRIRRLV
jgi:hypothetical protein